MAIVWPDITPILQRLRQSAQSFNRKEKNRTGQKEQDSWCNGFMLKRQLCCQEHTKHVEATWTIHSLIFHRLREQFGHCDFPALVLSNDATNLISMDASPQAIKLWSNFISHWCILGKSIIYLNLSRLWLAWECYECQSGNFLCATIY